MRSEDTPRIGKELKFYQILFDWNCDLLANCINFSRASIGALRAFILFSNTVWKMLGIFSHWRILFQSGNSQSWLSEVYNFHLILASSMVNLIINQHVKAKKKTKRWVVSLCSIRFKKTLVSKPDEVFYSLGKLIRKIPRAAGLDWRYVLAKIRHFKTTLYRQWKIDENHTITLHFGLNFRPFWKSLGLKARIFLKFLPLQSIFKWSTLTVHLEDVKNLPLVPGYPQHSENTMKIRSQLSSHWKKHGKFWNPHFILTKL